jgi:hypothetical protein
MSGYEDNRSEAEMVREAVDMKMGGIRGEKEGTLRAAVAS